MSAAHYHRKPIAVAEKGRQMKVFQHDMKLNEWLTVFEDDAGAAREFLDHTADITDNNPSLEFFLAATQIDAMRQMWRERERQATGLRESIAEQAPGRVTADTIRKYCGKFGTQATFDDIPKYQDYQEYLENRS